MAWKKLVYSGSDAKLSSLQVDSSITASTFYGDAYRLPYLGINRPIIENDSVVSVFYQGDIDSEIGDSGTLTLQRMYGDQILTQNLGRDILFFSKNVTGGSVGKAVPVFISGSDSFNRLPLFYSASSKPYSNQEQNKNYVIGLTYLNSENTAVAPIINHGIIQGVNTSNFNSGDRLYVSSSGGQLTNIRPPEPYNSIEIGHVIHSDSVSGSIFVSIKEPIRINTVSEFTQSSNYSNYDLWVYNSNKSVWENRRKNINVSDITSSVASSSYIDLDRLIAGTSPAWKEGRVYYDTELGALTVYNDESEISLQVGQETYIRVYNNSGGNINNGTPVYISGSQGDYPYCWPAVSEDYTTHTINENHIIGVATHTIENNSTGYVTTQGTVRGINTINFAAGDMLFVSTSVGQLTNIQPPNPYDIRTVGYVVRSHASAGIIYVYPKEPTRITKVSEFTQSANYSNGDLWVYNSSKKVWENRRDNINISGSFSGSYIGDGSGLTGIVAIANPAGENKTIQFNDGGATSGSSKFTFDKNTNIVYLTGSLIATSLTSSLEGTSSYSVSSSYSFSSSFAVSASWAPGGGGVTDHGALTGLANDDHTQYALLAGRSSGQTLKGGTGITDRLTLVGTAGNGTSTAVALAINVGNNGGTRAVTIFNNGNVGFGVNATASLFPFFVDYNDNNYAGGIGLRNSNTGTQALAGINIYHRRAEVDDSLASNGVSQFTFAPSNYANGLFSNTVMLNTLQYSTLTTHMGIMIGANSTTTSGNLFFGNRSTGVFMLLSGGTGTDRGCLWLGSGNSKTVTPAAKLHIVGRGTTTAITLKITNSTPTEILNVIDDGRVGIGTASPNASAALDIISTTRGFGVPAMTSTQRNAISSPREGLMIYDSTVDNVCVYVNTAWARLAYKDEIVSSNTSAATFTPNVDTHDMFIVTALAESATFNAPTGTATNGQRLTIRIKDNGTARNLTWNAIYRVVGTTLPTATTANKTIYVHCIYNVQDVDWDVIMVNIEA